MSLGSLSNGWIFIDKPKGITSFDVIRKVRRFTKIKKIGHSGTLDPFATGVLALAFGEATKSIQFLSSIKEYDFEVTFGETRDTDDVTGNVIESNDMYPSLESINSCIMTFIGTIDQVPPNYSAVKVEGQRAYKLARKGKTFDLGSKKVEIYKFQCLAKTAANIFSLRVKCSSGTYIRSLARDIAEKLGCFAHVSSLRRTGIGKINEKNLISLDKFEELVHIGDHFDYVHTIQDVLDDIPAVLLSYENACKFQNGVKLDFDIKSLGTKNVLFISENGPLGVGKINNNKINPIRVFNIVGKRDVDK
ncbi:MAG: tRNA pseudouridine(55) synthase TruB [Pelagibacterales bacterium]|nr:tRNA pseudouridine(55) synthase TruB [Pelagibacterales bacterium]